MDMEEIENRLIKVIAECDGQLPSGQLADMRELTEAGEPGVALENLCTQLYEYGVWLDLATLRQIAEIGKAMGVEPRYWELLEVRE